MKESKLIGTLKSLTAEEMKSFGKFVASPYFSVGRDVKALYSIIKKYYPEFNSDDLERENLFEILFPLQTYNEAKLKNIFSALTNLAKQFLVHNSIKANGIEYEKLLAVNYKNRNNDKPFIGTLKSLEAKLQLKPFDSIDCFDEERGIEQMKEDFYLRKEEYDEAVSAKLSCSEYCTISFLIRFLRTLKDKIIITDAYNMSFESPIIDVLSESIDFEKIIRRLGERKYHMLWLIRIYYYAFKSASNLKDRSSYQKFKDAVQENIEKFSQREKYVILNDLFFYCTKNFINTGQIEFMKESFEISKQMLTHNAYSPSDGKHFNLVTFRNIAFIALRMKEFRWLKGFLKNYIEKLKPEYRENMLNLVKAYLSFEEGKFNDALEYVNKVQYDNFTYKLDIKNIMLRIFYELSLFDQAFSLVDTYKHFLDNTKEFSEPYKLQYRNFITVYDKILKAKSIANTENIDSAMIDIKKLKVLASRAWLMQKVTELIGNGDRQFTAKVERADNSIKPGNSAPTYSS